MGSPANWRQVSPAKCPYHRMYLYAKPQIASYNRSHGKHERHAFDVAASLLFFAFTNDVRIEADPELLTNTRPLTSATSTPLTCPVKILRTQLRG